MKWSETHQRRYFWLVLSCLSVFFAEVVSCYAPTGVFSKWGAGVLIPLYGLHALILGAIMHRKGTPHVSALMAAGAVFGLYEAYITKELWNPSAMHNPALSAFGIDIPTLLSVIVFWHPLMAFLLPLWTADVLLLHTGQWRFWTPRWIRRRILDPKRLLWMATWFGLFWGVLNGVMHKPTDGYIPNLLVLLHVALLAGLVWIWNSIKNRPGYSMHDVLPQGKELYWCGGVLLLYYCALGAIFRLDALPALKNQLSLWVLYALFTWLMLRSSRWSYGQHRPVREHRLAKGPQALIVFGVSLAVTSAPVFATNPVVRNLVYFCFMLTGVIWSLWMLSQALRLALAHRRIRLRRYRKSVRADGGVTR